MRTQKSRSLVKSKNGVTILSGWVVKNHTYNIIFYVESLIHCSVPNHVWKKHIQREIPLTTDDWTIIPCDNVKMYIEQHIEEFL